MHAHRRSSRRHVRVAASTDGFERHPFGFLSSRAAYNTRATRLARRTERRVVPHTCMLQTQQGSLRARCVAVGWSANFEGPMANRIVLVVDDDAEMGRAIADHLASDGARCEVVVDGASALDACRKQAFDAVLTDICMA